MNFSDRIMTIKLYREWKEQTEEEKNLKMDDNLETFLVFLEIKGLLISPEDYNAEIDALCEDIEYESDMLFDEVQKMFDSLNYEELNGLQESMHKRINHLYDLNYDRARKINWNERKKQNE